MSTPASTIIMQGVSRFLSRRDKRGEKRLSRGFLSKSHPAPSDLYTILIDEELKAPDKDEEKKIKALIQRLQTAGITKFGEKQAHYVLSRYPDDPDRAFETLSLASDSFDGILREFDPSVKLLGAENRNMVTCYLDALLFAMFARLDSFEAILFSNFEDEPRKRLAAILRLWVNFLRTGRLIPVVITKHLQDALGKCGWEEATIVRQQDASEAFTFITGALELPLLTLKMDIYHTGREVKEDDHKFVNERLLEVAIPSEEQADKVITLEDCLETYFNNKIEVKRHLQRQNTLKSRHSTFNSAATPDSEKGNTMHIETIEVAESPTVATPTSSYPPASPVRPLEGRRRADSIFSERYVNRQKSAEKSAFDEKQLLEEMLNTSGGRPRSSSLRKEVLMPAWQFFSLIPWYTDNVPQTDAQVAAHFSAKRPVLGICLKRYSMLPDGTPKRLNTFVDIPLEIGLPHFISDDRMEEEGPLFGNFKLVLQSVVCHRGVSVDSGHYVAISRANLPDHHRPGSAHSEDNADQWLLMDDLAKDRVVEVDMKKALKGESPYLLFYQVQPIDEALARGDPPPYNETQSELPSEMPSVDQSTDTLGMTDVITINTETAVEDADPSEVLQLDTANLEDPAGRSSISSNHRNSAVLEELENLSQTGTRGRTAPTTPEDQKLGFLTTSRRNSKNWIGGNKSRPTSQSGESRLSLTMSRLTGRTSKDKLQGKEAPNQDDQFLVVNGHADGANDGAEAPSPVKLGSNSIARSKSRKGKAKDKKAGDAHEDKKRFKRPDRECIVM
jgi:hypothetical protein